MALSCAELRQRLDADDAVDAADVRAHVAGCAECRRALERWRAVTGELRVWAEAPPPAFLHARVMAGLRAAPERERQSWRGWFARRPVWASSALAAVLVAVVVSVTVRHSPTVARVPEPAGTADGEQPANAPESPPALLTAGASERNSELARGQSLATRLTQAEETSRLQKRRVEPEAQPKKEKGSRVPLNDGLGERDQEALRHAEAPQEMKRAAVPAPAPQRWASGSAAGAPASRVESAPAMAEVQAIAATAAQHEDALDRAPAQEPNASRAKAAAPRMHARLVPLAGGPARPVEVSAALLASAPQFVDVDAAGRLRLFVDATEPVARAGVSLNGRRDDARLSGGLSDERALANEDRRAIEALGLTPGRYRLEKIEE